MVALLYSRQTIKLDMLQLLQEQVEQALLALRNQITHASWLQNWTASQGRGNTLVSSRLILPIV